MKAFHTASKEAVSAPVGVPKGSKAEPIPGSNASKAIAARRGRRMR
jgi:hypothetical protein